MTLPEVDDQVVTREVVLERLRVAALQVFDRHTLADVDVRVLSDVMGRVAFRLERSVWAQRLTDDVEQASVLVPETWWDHLKLTMPPGLWRFWNLYVFRLRPPRRREHVLRVRWRNYAAFPDAHLPQVPREHLGRPVLWQTRERLANPPEEDPGARR